MLLEYNIYLNGTWIHLNLSSNLFWNMPIALITSALSPSSYKHKPKVYSSGTYKGLIYNFIGTAKGYNTPRLASKIKVRFLRMPHGLAPR